MGAKHAKHGGFAVRPHGPHHLLGWSPGGSLGVGAAITLAKRQTGPPPDRCGYGPVSQVRQNTRSSAWSKCFQRSP
ncbi:hypothetical protein [Nocardia australiensis]|uniref:hypothetical protein n=1 Tax=Nocardia australiensis TaxID=2887191 RepID=UPI001D1433BE|nr:hypothetical protein [Nocardia australiensis]